MGASAEPVCICTYGNEALVTIGRNRIRDASQPPNRSARIFFSSDTCMFSLSGIEKSSSAAVISPAQSCASILENLTKKVPGGMVRPCSSIKCTPSKRPRLRKFLVSSLNISPGSDGVPWMQHSVSIQSSKGAARREHILTAEKGGEDERESET